MAAGAERVPPTESQAAFLVNECGENPDDWHRVSDDLIVLNPLEVHCTATGPLAGAVRCQRRAGHSGDHSASYYHLGGLGCTDVWGPVTDHVAAKAK